MTNAAARTAIHDNATPRRAAQPTSEGAALRGELGLESQLNAMAELYRELRAAGELDAAAAVKAEARRLAGK